MTKTTYKVTGPVPYAGHKPGETFEADLPEEQEQRALDRGAIEVVRTTKKKEAGDA
jgi:hypothetical protein